MKEPAVMANQAPVGIDFAQLLSNLNVPDAIRAESTRLASTIQRELQTEGSTLVAEYTGLVNAGDYGAAYKAVVSRMTAEELVEEQRRLTDETLQMALASYQSRKDMADFLAAVLKFALIFGANAAGIPIVGV